MLREYSSSTAPPAYALALRRHILLHIDGGLRAVTVFPNLRIHLPYMGDTGREALREFCPLAFLR